MEFDAASSELPSMTSRLEDAVEELDRKLGSLDEWMDRTNATFEDWQLRWRICSESISSQLEMVEQELPPVDPRPQLRVF